MAQAPTITIKDRMREKAHQSLRNLYNEMLQTQPEEPASNLTSEEHYSPSDFTMLVCDSLVEQLGLVVQKVRFARNATLSISRLPNELLHQIIAFALPDTDLFEYHHTLLSYRLVCVTWWRFIDTVPAFWTVISCMMDAQALDTALTRSQSLSLDIHCDCPYDMVGEDDGARRWCSSARGAFWDQFKTHVGRWQSLTIMGQTDHIINRFLSTPCGSLISLNVGAPDGRWGGWEARPQELFGNQNPKLRHITAQSFKMPWEFLDLSQLRSLSLIFPPQFIDIVAPSTFPLLFERSPQLHTLKIMGNESRYGAEDEDDILPSPARVTDILLPLKSLTLQHLPPDIVLDVLHPIKISNTIRDVEFFLDSFVPRPHYPRHIEDMLRVVSDVRFDDPSIQLKINTESEEIFLIWGGLKVQFRNPDPKLDSVQAAVSTIFNTIQEQSRTLVTELDLELGWPTDKADWTPFFADLAKWLPSLKIIKCHSFSEHWLLLLGLLSEEKDGKLLFPNVEEATLQSYLEDTAKPVEPKVLELATRAMEARPALRMAFRDICVWYKTLNGLKALGSRLKISNDLIW